MPQQLYAFVCVVTLFCQCKEIEYLNDVDFEQSDEDIEDLEHILKPRRAPSSPDTSSRPQGHACLSGQDTEYMCLSCS